MPELVAVPVLIVTEPPLFVREPSVLPPPEISNTLPDAPAAVVPVLSTIFPPAAEPAGRNVVNTNLPDTPDVDVPAIIDTAPPESAATVLVVLPAVRMMGAPALLFPVAVAAAADSIMSAGLPPEADCTMEMEPVERTPGPVLNTTLPSNPLVLPPDRKVMPPEEPLVVVAVTRDTEPLLPCDCPEPTNIPPTCAAVWPDTPAAPVDRYRAPLPPSDTADALLIVTPPDTPVPDPVNNLTWPPDAEVLEVVPADNRMAPPTPQSVTPTNTLMEPAWPLAEGEDINTLPVSPQFVVPTASVSEPTVPEEAAPVTAAIEPVLPPPEPDRKETAPEALVVLKPWPVAMIILPDVPECAVPDDSTILPLTPVLAAFADRITRAPDELLVL